MTERIESVEELQARYDNLDRKQVQDLHDLLAGKHDPERRRRAYIPSESLEE